MPRLIVPSIGGGIKLIRTLRAGDAATLGLGDDAGVDVADGETAGLVSVTADEGLGEADGDGDKETEGDASCALATDDHATKATKMSPILVFIPSRQT